MEIGPAILSSSKIGQSVSQLNLHIDLSLPPKYYHLIFVIFLFCNKGNVDIVLTDWTINGIAFLYNTRNKYCH